MLITLKHPSLKPSPSKFLSRPRRTLARLDFPTPVAPLLEEIMGKYYYKVLILY